MSTTLAYLALAAAILLGIAGQIALKSGAVGAPSFAAQLFNPLTLMGLMIYGLASIAYIAAINRIPVSMAFPSVAASYAIIAVLAHLLWNEPLGWQQVAGIALIGGGIILIHQ
ncbi:MAG TPA: EamA family transporter [Stellaceae bacterium]|jgi:undecaprenyl phosphate-alpha-L-ara4N flippase subunit ArnE|nr:EamA family transporter [Stellaceae bacterium]